MKRLWNQLFAKNPPTETTPEPVAPVEDEPVTQQLPRYVKLRYSHRRNDVPLYEQTADFLGRSPLDGVAVGSLAFADVEPEWGVSETLTGRYAEFAWSLDKEPGSPWESINPHDDNNKEVSA